jgi:3-phenylpropionate/trans-cinnamate dioxygenase ferredoxin reductase subunit
MRSREFIAFWLRDGRLQAAMNVNVWDCGDQLEALLEMTAEVDARHLADPAVPLGDLVAGQLPATVPYSPST